MFNFCFASSSIGCGVRLAAVTSARKFCAKHGGIEGNTRYSGIVDSG